MTHKTHPDTFKILALYKSYTYLLTYLFTYLALVMSVINSCVGVCVRDFDFQAADLEQALDFDRPIGR